VLGPSLSSWVIIHYDNTGNKTEKNLASSTAIVKARRFRFDNILDRVTGSDPSVTDYILAAPAKCPNCKRGILEKTSR